MMFKKVKVSKKYDLLFLICVILIFKKSETRFCPVSLVL